MSRKKSPTEKRAETLGMSPVQFLDVLDHFDYQILSLSRWLGRLDIDLTVRRSKTDNERFVFERDGVNIGGTLSYDRARSFMAGLTIGLNFKEKNSLNG